MIATAAPEAGVSSQLFIHSFCFYRSLRIFRSFTFAQIVRARAKVDLQVEGVPTVETEKTADMKALQVSIVTKYLIIVDCLCVYFKKY